MKIVVFSDSHRDIAPMVDVVEIMKPDMIIHLGDHIYDAVELERQFMDIPMVFLACANWRSAVTKIYLSCILQR